MGIASASDRDFEREADDDSRRGRLARGPFRGDRRSVAAVPAALARLVAHGAGGDHLRGARRGDRRDRHACLGAGMFGGLRSAWDARDPLLHGVVAMAVAGFFPGGMIRMAVNQVRGRRPHLEDLFSVTDVWFDLCVGSILVGSPCRSAGAATSSRAWSSPG